MLFSKLLESDKRSPLITFHIPGLITQYLGVESRKLGVVAPSIQFWFAIAVVRPSNIDLIARFCFMYTMLGS